MAKFMSFAVALFASVTTAAELAADYSISEASDWRRAEGSDLAARRLTSCAESNFTMSGTLMVVKVDRFGTEQPFLDVSLETDTGLRYELRFPGTGNMAANVSRTHGQLVNGMSVNVDCCNVTEDETAEFHQETCSEERRASSSCISDSRPICIVMDLQGRRLSSSTGATGRHLSSGMAPSVAKYLLVMVHVCGTGYTASDIDAVNLHEMFHGSTAGTFATLLGSCSRSSTSVDSAVKQDIVQVCPSDPSFIQIWYAVQDQLSSNERSYGLAMIIPDAYLDAAGIGIVGREVVWIKESVSRFPGIYLHEIGHNWMLGHAGNPRFEYQDDTSAMGYCCVPRCFHFIHSWQLGYAEYAGELDGTNLESDASFNLWIPDLGSHRNSGIKFRANGKDYVLSYRGGSGFDSILHNSLVEQVYVHTFADDGLEGGRNEAKNTILLHSVSLNSQAAIDDTDFQLHVTGLLSNGTAAVRLCRGDGTSGCPGEVVTSSPGTTSISTTTPTYQATLPAWDLLNTEYFMRENSESELTDQAMVGIGCKGQYCQEVRTVHWTGVLIHEARAWEQIGSSLGMLRCPANHAISQLKCMTWYGRECGTYQVRCAMVQGGSLSSEQRDEYTSEFFPAALHSESTQTCPDYFVLTGLRCANTACAKKSLFCQRFIPSTTCTPSCTILRRECGSDGCGSTCGSCSGSGIADQCEESVGRCIARKLVGSTWASSHSVLGMQIFSDDHAWEGVIASGMECEEDYCARVRLLFINIQVDGTEVDRSDWISDQDGADNFFYLFGTDEAEVRVADCPKGKAVSSIECDGRYCNNIRLWCSKPYQWVVDEDGDPYQSVDWFSSEEGVAECPENHVLTGVECKESTVFCLLNCDSYCNRKKLRCRRIHPETIGASNLGVLKSAGLLSRNLTKHEPTMMVNGAAPGALLLPLILATLMAAFFDSFVLLAWKA